MSRVPLDSLFAIIESKTFLSLVSVANGLEPLFAALEQQAAVAELSLNKDPASIERVAARFAAILNSTGGDRSTSDLAALIYARHLFENGYDVRPLLRVAAAGKHFNWSLRFLRAIESATPSLVGAGTAADSVGSQSRIVQQLEPRELLLAASADAWPSVNQQAQSSTHEPIFEFNDAPIPRYGLGSVVVGSPNVSRSDGT